MAPSMRRVPSSDLPFEVVADWACMAARAHQAFVAVFGEHKIPMTNKFLKIGDETALLFVDAELTEISRNLPAREFDERILGPAAANLAQQTPRGRSFVPLEIPPGCQSARHGDGFVSIRTTAGWRQSPIFEADEITGYDEPTPVLRLCIMTTTNLPETV